MAFWPFGASFQAFVSLRKPSYKPSWIKIKIYIDKEKIFQFDTTNKSAEESAKIIKNFMAGNVKLEETFDYSERIMDWY